MNNKMLNREFQSKMLIEKKRFNAKSGFTDSEDEEETSTKCKTILSHFPEAFPFFKLNTDKVLT
jgi:hypothetical protein